MALSSGSIKLTYLRQLMKNFSVHEQKGIQAYLITADDAHQSEYVRERDKRRQYISGFKGSRGTVVITEDSALLWTDGRYFAQAESELDPPNTWILMKEGISGTLSIEDWLVSNLPPKSIVGADPNLISYAKWTQIHNTLILAGHKLLPIENNLVDEVWGHDQPVENFNKIVPHSITFSGKTAGDKVKYCFQMMELNKISILILTALDEIAYLLNWRGSDIPFNPVFYAYIILFCNRVHIFVNQERLTLEAKIQLLEENVDFVLHPYKNIRQFLATIKHSPHVTKIWISNSSSYIFHSDCKNSVPICTSITPVSLMKLVKNDTEISGMISAHIRDAISLIKYFAWLENTINTTSNNQILTTEISAAEKLEEFRKEHDTYIGPSFQTISAVGKHGAIIHYVPSCHSDISINHRELYLCDAGAQFLDGTTDVTRTLHFGQPSDFEKECFTMVFKGQCNLAMSKFPALIKGNYLDTLARKHLWNIGLDYLHGTGHGVGAYLNVHEYPTMISYRPYPEDPGLQNGMFLSNEPGYYEEDIFGIRIENIERVTKANTKYNRMDRKFLKFDTVTLVPIQTKLLNTSMLTDDEVQFINNYHSKCYKTIKPYLQGCHDYEALIWLQKETQSITK